MEEMNTIEMQAQESAAGTAGYAESTAPAGPEAPQGDLGGADNEGTGARRQTPEEKQYNPYQIPNETLVYYFLLRPELQDKYALTNENDVRMLNLFVKMIFNKLNPEEIPGITLEGK